MKNKTLLLFCFLCFSCSAATIKNNANIEFEYSEFDFGELQLNGNANCDFVFQNPGNTPLVIQQVKTSCGCTVPEWPTKPIKPGKRGDIKINYDTSHPGVFSKTITVFYNGPGSPKTLIIKGLVNYGITETTGTKEAQK